MLTARLNPSLLATSQRILGRNTKLGITAAVHSSAFTRSRPLARTLSSTSAARVTVAENIAKMVRPAGLTSNRYYRDDMPDLNGKVAVVTGGSRGIGYQVAKSLASKGCEVHIVSATEEHGQDAVQTIATETSASPTKLHYHNVDLGSLKSVISLSEELRDSLPRLDILYLIAGIGVAPYGETKDGLGNHFGVNNLSQLAMTDVILPKMLETAKGKMGEERYSTRIVAEASELHRTAPSDFKAESLAEMCTGEPGPNALYGRSKLCNILFIRSLAKRLPSLTSDTPIMAIAVHPGAVQTEQQKGATEAYPIAGKILEKASQVLFMTPEQGSESAVWAGVSEDVAKRAEEVQAGYFSEAFGKVGTESDQAKDEALAERFWNLEVQTLKDKVGYEVKL